MMRTLNDPVPFDDVESDDLDWTPAKGMARAAVRGGVAALIVSAVLAPLVIFVPFVAFYPCTRAAMAFIVAWILFGVVQRAAGMVGMPVSALAIALAVMVLLFQHVLVTLWGITGAEGASNVWRWLHPAILLSANIFPLAAVIGCAVLRHSGGADLQTLADITNIRVWRIWWR